MANWYPEMAPPAPEFPGPAAGEMVSERLRRFPDVSGLQALGTRFHFELDLVPFGE